MSRLHLVLPGCLTPRIVLVPAIAWLAAVWLAVWPGICPGAEPESAEPENKESPLAVPAAGEPFAARLVGAEGAGEQWRFDFLAGGARRTVEAGELVRWGEFAELDQGPVVVLADGSLLVADLLEADGETLSVDSLLVGTLRLPLEAVAGLVLRLPASRAQSDRLLDEVLRAQGNTDRLVLDNGDRLEGLFVGLETGADALSSEQIRFRGRTGELDIEIQRVAWLAFNPLLRQKPLSEGLRAWVGLTDGSRVLARRLQLDEDRLELTPAVLDQAWQGKAGVLKALQPLGGRVVYLSDLEPSGYRHVPYLDISWPSKRDRNVLGGLLRAGDRLYLKGLGVHSASRLSYELDGEFDRFEAELALDDAAQGRGSVQFRVYVDGKEQFQSPPVRGFSAPVPLSLDIRGARRLDLIVGFGERADELDRADWLDARLVRGQANSEPADQQQADPATPGNAAPGF